ncbi:DUF202 domain-containing protein [Glutamicibacter sp. JL.03c]|uniref:DUF202 domain-containing protein n=1 Tax=Glutamicibacter sp. JL.03c TaxID=2984842 RepID=UPI0021F77D3C|nr:DUF202 domain-containing protein [Glutamicibacter sp. JL.03c]UYQ77424.1 DUF202 domain-containing protein [Glutamicibacter sp. JL.03c]
MSDGFPAPRDPGLQPERTVMAWSRTMYSFFITGAIFLHWLPAIGASAIWLCALSVLAGLGILGSQRTRYRRMDQQLRRQRMQADATAVLATTALLVIVAAGALALVLLG